MYTKSRIENVHKELHSAFQVVYRTKFAALKSDKEIEAYMEEYEEEEEVEDDAWYEINKINENFIKIYDKNIKHPLYLLLLKVLRFEKIDYLINNRNNDDLELWWYEYEYESDEDDTENNEVVAEVVETESGKEAHRKEARRKEEGR